ncbi:ABC transporter ATP-binding protein [Clostridium sp. 'White wine YQ']|uniref:ABC transporter ATP-binding protein n=1 Tax=Clostridium sp. 'White wine YQ' TaxID=3027474 RepID=UPI002365FF29|nr:ABC transporter ATP-binding protein [Clostridium sp. 'White wine YQ']MDD7795202.1 ABC transporter ATP-binding protein [Clostridium sp. 'White wine YQ']
MEILLEVKNVKKSFGRKIILDGVEFTLEKGKVLGILGPNGSGKTTLLNLIQSFLKPTEGEIYIDGKVAGVETKGRVSMLQDKNIFSWWMKVKDGIEFYKEFFGDFDEEKANSLLDRFKIDRAQKIKSLSKGTYEKFAIILALSRNAKLFILDEPLSGIDPLDREEVTDIIINNLNEESSMIVTTHLVAELERIFDEVAFVKDRKIFLKGDSEILREERNSSLEEIYREIYKR